jgi:NADH-quinone oxidoreductase subunit H
MNFLVDPINFIAGWITNLLLGWGLPADLIMVLIYILGGGALATVAMLWVTILIWYERKLIGRIQDRFGPNRVGPFGIFQPFADMLKIFTKEHILPDGVDWFPFTMAPVIAVGAVLALWAVIPFTINAYGVDLNVAILYLLAIGGIGELAIVFGGWGSNNKYALLAAFRAVAQLISYETPYVICFLLPVMFAGSMSLTTIIKAQDTWFIFLSPLGAAIFFITSMAEVGRTPFDLVEAESELVAGFNIEYSGLKFGMFYVGDFLHAFTISLLFAALFLGGWRGPWADTIPILGFVYFFIKSSAVYFMVILLRASMPRFRIDQLMDYNWKLLTPLSLAVVAFTALVDKLLPPNLGWVRIGGLLLLNLFLFIATDRLLDIFWRKRLNEKFKPLDDPENTASVKQGAG